MSAMKRIYPLYLSLLSLLGGCAGLPADFEEPSLVVTAVDFREQRGMSPQFDVTLHVTNPNRVPLNIAGMSYDIVLAGNKVVSGVASEIPEIAPYGEADFSVSAVLSILGGINLVRQLVNSGDRIDYEFNARLDVGSFRPRIDIREAGEIRLR